ncbi:peptidylprolyl isomerase [Cellvibrio zantedeschiae]|uniref:Periplasmic chaperone PpiD n=1 Tax=Cellvibrio zantedeschiae TaxID=1237077 RepID=A0ABQ3B0H6_9GAMM|nr:SurA N-terminal domain-containing protein [Cellvibrio zantedeschiae]GGY71550.1 peptidylprolyl isomerase [Cellvibrio zantedeschiae]
MLQELRDKSTGMIAKIIIGFIIVIFALFGTEALFQNYGAADKAITVNGEKITEDDIARGIQNRKQQILNRYGESVPAEYLTDEKLRQPVIESLIQRELLAQVAKKGGLAANSAAINNEIATTPAFQQDGVFNQERFLQILRYQGLTPANYQNVIAEETVINQLQFAIAYTSFVTPAELKNIIGLSFQSRDFNYFVIPSESVEKNVVVDDKDIKAHYDANAATYTTPEQVAVDYIELSTGELAKNIAVTDDQVQKQYEQNTKAFVAKTERQAAHILFEGADAQKRAEEVKAKLAAGEDFAKLAGEFSTDAGSKNQGGDLGFSAGDAFPTEFESALAKLKVGEVSAPVKTEAGVHIIKLISERGSKAPTFEEAKAGIIDQLKRSEAESQFGIKLEKLKDRAFNADNLGEVANELGLTAQNTGLFSKTGGKDLTANNAFVTAAFSPEVLEEGNASDIIELEPSRVIVLKKTDRKPAQLQPLDSVKDQIATVVRAEKVQALLSKQAQDVIAAINTGASIADQAKALGLELKAATGITRNDSATDRDVLQYAFSLAAPASDKPVSGSVRTAKGDYAVVALSGVHLAGEEKVPAEQRAAIASQLANINGGYDFKSFQSHLQEVAKIKQ